ncbi:hypothetical protein HGRIS_010606 [Hohenbuehelia grisea]|uniref:Uncharacterized protein n=1 Tax=Hohenbuehelia grisea TaxID=104357 RepID=A0ABR3IXY6_9AGAR
MLSTQILQKVTCTEQPSRSTPSRVVPPSPTNHHFAGSQADPSQPNPHRLPLDYGLRRAATQPTGMSVSEARQYLTKLRSRSLAALQLEGRRAVPHSPPGPTLLENMRPQERLRWQPMPLPALNTNLAPPPFTPSALLEASPDVERASPMIEHPKLSNAFMHIHRLTPHNLHPPPMHGPRPGAHHELQSQRMSRERSGLPAPPSYEPVEGLDTQQDERLRQRRSRNGIVFTVARGLPDLPACPSGVQQAMRCF